MTDLLKQLKEITEKVLDAYRADQIELSAQPHCGVTFEEALMLIGGDFIPDTAALDRRSSSDLVPHNYTNDYQGFRI